MQSSNISINEVQLFRQSLAVEFASNEDLSKWVQELKEVLNNPDISTSTKAWIETRLKRLDSQMRTRFLHKLGAVA